MKINYNVYKIINGTDSKGNLIYYYRVTWGNNKRMYYKEYELMKWGYAKVMKNGLWGVIDRNGETVLTRKYKSIEWLGKYNCRVFDGKIYKTINLKRRCDTM